MAWYAKSKTDVRYTRSEPSGDVIMTVVLMYLFQILNVVVATAFINILETLFNEGCFIENEYFNMTRRRYPYMF